MTHLSERRVAVTGLGVKTPLGTSVLSLMQSLDLGISAAAPVPELIAAELPVSFGCRVPDFDTSAYFSPRQIRQVDRAGLLAISAAVDAVQAADFTTTDPRRTGVFVGVGAGGLLGTESLAAEYAGRLARVPAYTVPRLMANSSAAQLSIRYNAQGSSLTYSMACASGTIAIGEGMRRIRSGELDAVIAGGTEAAISPGIVAGFTNAGAMSSRVSSPAEASRPFDAGRDGFVIGEGAGFLVLENWEVAQKRGAPIIAELAGYGANSDAYHIVAPRPDGELAVACMRLAIADAGLQASEIGHINAHGTSTAQNDKAEALAIIECFGEGTVPVTAPKGALGHSLGASGAIEAVIAVASMSSGHIPPTANFEAGDETTSRLDIVSSTARSIGVAPVLSNSFAFGGHNASLVFAPGVEPRSS